MSDEFASIDLNLGSVQTFTPAPDGVYDVRIAEVETKKSKAGNQMAVCTIEIVGGEFEGKKVWENLVFTEKALWKVQEVLKAFTGDDWSDDNMTLKPQELVGYTARAQIALVPHHDAAKANAGHMKNEIVGYIDESSSDGISLT